MLEILRMINCIEESIKKDNFKFQIKHDIKSDFLLIKITKKTS